MEPPTPPESSAGTRERRRSPRVRVRSVLRTDLHHSGEPLPVRDLSFGGFGVESPAPMEAGTLHSCEFLLHELPSVTLLAQVVQSERASGRSDFVTHFRFAMIEPDAGQRVNGLIEAVAGALGFDPSSRETS